MKLQLVEPNAAYREHFLRALVEFQREGLAWWFGPDLQLAEKDFAAFVAKRRSEAERRAEPSVPKSHFWAISEDELVGRISLHHTLNEALRREGGHIGYDTVPSFRGRGVATEMLRQVLPRARALGLEEVLLTCDDVNVASIRVIEKNGGALRAKETLDPVKPPKRYYWISLV